MSMSTGIMAFKGQDKEWENMRDAYNACRKANVDIPVEVRDFFDQKEPSVYGAIVDIKNIATKWEDDMQEGLEIDLDKIPEDVRYIRFYNSW